MMLRGRSWRWLLLLVPLGLPGCIIFGGQTGDTSADASAAGPPNYPCDRARSLTYDETSSLGFSAAEMVAKYGGARTGRVSEADPDLWQALGVMPAPELPLSVALSIAHADGPARLDECSRYLSVDVTVSLDLGNGLLKRSGTGVLKGNNLSGSVGLKVELSPPAAGDRSTGSVTIDAQLGASFWQGKLVPSDLASMDVVPSATLTGS